MSFSIGAYRRPVLLAVVAAMVGLMVATLPAAPAAAATSQTLVPWGDHLRQAFVPTGLSDVTGIAAGGRELFTGVTPTPGRPDRTTAEDVLPE